MPVSARDNTAYHWRLLDAITHEHVRVLYDSAISIMPPDLAGDHVATQSAPMPFQVRTGVASSEMRLAMIHGLSQEHDIIRSISLEGYTALVVAPRTIRRWRDWITKRADVRDEDAEFGHRDNVSFEPCELR